MENEFILEIKDLNKSYGRAEIIKNMNLEIPKGVIYGFIGENGAGKTTTMNMICGLKKPSKGRIIFDNKELSYDNKREYIGYLPQQPKFYDYMKVREYLDFILSLSDDKNKVFTRDELLSIVGLLESSNKTINTLSGGMKQRLGIAVAICNNPKLVILDEPTSALDPEGRREVMNIIKDLKEKGMTIFFSTHLLADVENICDYITIIHKGEILKSSTLQDLKKNNSIAYYDITFEDEIEIKSCPSFATKIEKNKKIISIFINEDLKDERELFKYLLSYDSNIKSFAKKEVSLEEIFFNIIGGGAKNDI